MVPQEIERLFSRYVDYSKGGRPIGRDGRIRIEYFLDLLSAVHVEADLITISEFFSKELVQHANLEACDFIAVPKVGNGLLAEAVAGRIKKRSVFVRHSILFGRWLEGPARSGQQALLIDDIACDGEMLCEAIGSLRKSGVYVKEVWVLVDRAEGDASIRLGEIGVGYKSIFQLVDADLAKITRRGTPGDHKSPDASDAELS